MVMVVKKHAHVQMVDHVTLSLEDAPVLLAFMEIFVNKVSDLSR